MECGDCTVCCTLSVVKELEKKVWVTCHLCKDNGCSIYGKHPKSCKEFECAYLQGGENIELRPDKCGVMFWKKSDRIFCGSMIPGVPVTEMALKQVASFKSQGYSLVLFKKGEKLVFRFADGHDKEEISKEYINLLADGYV